ncbi:hypothetical protein ACJX0J_017768 [Zea mays]
MGNTLFTRSSPEAARDLFIKYTPEDVQERIQHLFEGVANGYHNLSYGDILDSMMCFCIKGAVFLQWSIALFINKLESCYSSNHKYKIILYEGSSSIEFILIKISENLPFSF